MIRDALTVASTLLWILLCYLFYRSGHRSGFLAGQTKEKATTALLMKSAHVAGRFEAWQEISDMIADVNANAESGDQRRQVH